MERSMAICAMAMIVIVAGCAKPMPELSRTEVLSMVNRDYQGTTPEDILVAAERVLRFSDADFTFQHFDDGFRATRIWVVYLIISGNIGTDRWSVKVRQDFGNSKITTQIGRASCRDRV